MKQYPDYKDRKFGKKIAGIFKRHKIPEETRSYDQICNPSMFKLQEPQKFLRDFIGPKSVYRDILIFHGIGSGKTCTAIQICEEWKKEKNILIVVPASLIGNFKDELRSLCAGSRYLTNKERMVLDDLDPSSDSYKAIIKKSDERIKKYYTIISYNKFIDNCKNNNISLNNTLLVIDEVHNMVSETGIYYKVLQRYLNHSPKDCIKVLLTATPIFDKPVELALTLNLLKLPNKLPTGNEFSEKFLTISPRVGLKNKKELQSLISGFVSYYRGAPPKVFPRMVKRRVYCEMSSYQHKTYLNNLRVDGTSAGTMSRVKSLSLEELPNDFYLASRIISNIVFPNGLSGKAGFKSLTKKKIRDNLHIYSPKLSKMVRYIQRCNGKIFIYSNFKSFGGLETVIKVLETLNYGNYSNYGEGFKRFAVWSGDSSLEYKEEIKHIFNMKENINGDRLKIILGSPSIKEGVTLKAVKQVHILEPYWNRSRLEQIIGRASRYCSHKELPEEDRIVKVYIYIATHELDMTVDKYIDYVAMRKERLIKGIEKLIMEAAVDCRLNINANKTNNRQINCI